MKIGIINNEDFEKINCILKEINKYENKKIDTVILKEIKQEIDIAFINKNKNIDNINFMLKKLNKDGIIILNSDEKDYFNKINFKQHKLITYGLNGKATVTASSVLEDEDLENTIQCCIQRTFPTVSKNMVEEQEFSVKSKNNDVVNILAAVTIGLVLDIEINSISQVII